ncbi:MAG: TadE/TadG family type IV pilus assembly protein [Nocardioidaceae bacterium]
MIKLFITLNLLGMRLMAPLDRALGDAHNTLRRARRDERGSVTIEQVIWAVALIVIAGGVVAAITAYVNSKKDQIK